MTNYTSATWLYVVVVYIISFQLLLQDKEELIIDLFHTNVLMTWFNPGLDEI